MRAFGRVRTHTALILRAARLRGVSKDGPPDSLPSFEARRDAASTSEFVNLFEFDVFTGRKSLI